MPTHRKKHGNKNGWYAVETGFWKPGPHLVLEEGFAYPEHSIFLDQYIVIEASGQVSVYRNWFQDFTRETITAELEQAGFCSAKRLERPAWDAFYRSTEWIGLVAQKLDHIELPDTSFCGANERTAPEKKGCV